ncbi:epoxide hydrolase 4-like [Sycon ciliatum]|uniref:epoxide hydrolase 4-like n=1 Tax=Sycon ciliatum TaxID=27933 RepID=UPI0031F69536
MILSYSLPTRLFLRALVTAIALVLALISIVPLSLSIFLAGFRRQPRAALLPSRRRARSDPPSVYFDPSLGKHATATVNGVEIYYVWSGDADKPLMLLLHGFPECWYSWRHQLQCPELQAKYRLVAVDMRGYGRSSKPSYFPGAYHSQLVAEDMHHFIRALGYDSCVVAAHDWGGHVAYSLARHFPESVDRLIVLDLPEERVMLPFILFNPSQIIRSLYIAFFQLPVLPEFMFSIYDYEAVNAVFRGKALGVTNADRISDEDMHVYKWAISRPEALNGSLNYYRNVLSLIAPIQPFHRRAVDCYPMPTLILWGENDGVLDSRMAGEHKNSGLFDDVNVHVIANSSHWVQQDEPDIVNRHILSWLVSKAMK